MSLRPFTPVDDEDPRGAVRVKRINLTPATGTTAGSLGYIKNPFGEAAVVVDLILNVVTPATGAATADIGIAADAVTSGDTLIDGVDIGTAAILATAQLEHANTATGNAAGQVAIAAGSYITVSQSASSVGLVGTLSALFVKVAAVS